jgi:multidrug efflux system membrane fusion protein
VAIALPEQTVEQFPLGRSLAVELWAAPGKRFPGQLRELAPAADPQTRTYAARVSFVAPAVTVDLGQSARVYAQDNGAGGMALPLSALVEKDGGSAVWVIRSERVGEGEQRQLQSVVRLVRVKIGPYAEDQVPVLGGLKPDDWVVAAGGHLLREGQAVRPVDRKDRAVVTTVAKR